jgi:CheY-like chemotaxis protein/two-component sensor histidine kinase
VFTLQLEVVAQYDLQRSAREQLQHLRRQVSQCIQEARRSVWELRSPRLEAHDLVEAFRLMADDAMSAVPSKIRVTANGRPRRCAPHVEEQLLRIGQEAISNAVRHGEAAEIDITLEYSGTSVSLSIADNGRGFVVEIRSQAPAGHWGLENMRERAAEVGGRFGITSDRHRHGHPRGRRLKAESIAMKHQTSVLCVDDHRLMREGIVRIINGTRRHRRRRRGHGERRSTLRPARPDVTLMDLQLRGMNGLQAIRDLRKLAPDARIVVLTIRGREPITRCRPARYSLLKDLRPMT